LIVDAGDCARNDKGEIEGVKYDRITAVLVNAVREQQEQMLLASPTCPLDSPPEYVSVPAGGRGCLCVFAFEVRDWSASVPLAFNRFRKRSSARDDACAPVMAAAPSEAY